jgi:hypothetical protein
VRLAGGGRKRNLFLAADKAQAQAKTSSLRQPFEPVHIAIPPTLSESYVAAKSVLVLPAEMEVICARVRASIGGKRLSPRLRYTALPLRNLPSLTKRGAHRIP